MNKEENDSLEERVRERTKEQAGMTASPKKEVVMRQQAEGAAKALLESEGFEIIKEIP